MSEKLCASFGLEDQERSVNLRSILSLIPWISNFEKIIFECRRCFYMMHVAKILATTARLSFKSIYFCCNLCFSTSNLSTSSAATRFCARIRLNPGGYERTALYFDSTSKLLAHCALCKRRTKMRRDFALTMDTLLFMRRITRLHLNRWR